MSHWGDPDVGFHVRPDSVDFRDRLFRPTLAEVPSEVRLEKFREVSAPILDQSAGKAVDQHSLRKALRSSASAAKPPTTAWACTGFALATVVHCLLRRRKPNPDDSEVSEAMLFEMARRYDDYTGENYLGSSARGAMRGWHLHGVCARKIWDFKRHDDGRLIGGPEGRDPRLTAERAKDAQQRPLGAYFRVNHKDLVAMHCALAEVGVLLAVTKVHEGWFNARKDGTIRASTKIIGSHAVAIVAYDREGFWIQNSWSGHWAKEGFGHISYGDWLANGTDVWVARLGVPMDVKTTVSRIDSWASEWDRREIAVQLRPHLIRIHNDGNLQSNDMYGTSADDLERLFTDDIPNTWAGWKKKRLLLYVDGGLDPLHKAVQVGVANFRKVLLGQQVYPLTFVWRTGFWDTIGDVLRRARRQLHGDPAVGSDMDFLRDRLDDGIEPLARREGGKLQWDEVKKTATRSTTKKEGGVRLTLKWITELAEKDPSVEVHVVAHSAGAILLAPAIQLLTSTKTKITSGPMEGSKGLGVPVESCTLWAPACTTELFDKTYVGAIRERRIRRFLLLTLTEEAEKADTVGDYHKSLLHLISSALEEEEFVPDESEGQEIVGMQKLLKDDTEFQQLLRRRKSVSWRQSPAKMTDDRNDLRALHHGDFEADMGTLWATLGTILDRSPRQALMLVDQWEKLSKP